MSGGKSCIIVAEGIMKGPLQCLLKNKKGKPDYKAKYYATNMGKTENVTTGCSILRAVCGND